MLSDERLRLDQSGGPARMFTRLLFLPQPVRRNAGAVVAHRRAMRKAPKEAPFRSSATPAST